MITNYDKITKDLDSLAKAITHSVRLYENNIPIIRYTFCRYGEDIATYFWNENDCINAAKEFLLSPADGIIQKIDD